MSWVGAAIGAGSIGGALITGSAAQSAANTQANAANQATQAELDMYNQNRTDAAPWRDAGSKAITDISNNMGNYSKTFGAADFHEDPGYQFAMDQGNQAIERSAAARGGLDSGATMKALTRYSQGTADQQYQNAYDRFNQDRDQKFNKLASVAGIGQQAQQATAANGTATANSIGQNTMAAGNASAAGTMATANAINNGIGQGMNTWMNYSLMNSLTKKNPALTYNPADSFESQSSSLTMPELGASAGYGG